MTDQRIDALSPGTFELDGRDVEFAPGDTILQAATRAPCACVCVSCGDAG